MTIEIDFLRSLPYFEGLGDEELTAIRGRLYERTVGRGEIIQLEGKSAEALFVVAEGAVKVFKTSAEGKEQILSIVHAGESFNDIAVFDEGPTPASAQAMTPVTVYGISQHELPGILADYPRVALNTTRVLAERTRQLVSLVEDLSFRHVIGRVAKILLEYASEGGEARPRLTQQEIAAVAGTVREVVARSLKTLEEDGAIRLERHRIRITDRAALEDLVGSSA
jgi:CRP-like cAMP-binding protein